MQFAAAYADGSTSLYDAKSLKDVSLGSPIAEWKEPSSRFSTTTDEWVGLDISLSLAFCFYTKEYN
jgi:hypothetical protein